MNTANLDETGVVQPGSRVTYRLLVAGESDDLTGFKEWVEPQLVQGQRLSSVDESQPGIGATLDRARGFLLLAGSLVSCLRRQRYWLLHVALVNGTPIRLR